MQVKAIEVLPSHYINGVSYITPGKVYESTGRVYRGICDIYDDEGELIAIDFEGACPHNVVWEVLDAN